TLLGDFQDYEDVAELQESNEINARRLAKRLLTPPGAPAAQECLDALDDMLHAIIEEGVDVKASTVDKGYEPRDESTTNQSHSGLRSGGDDSASSADLNL